MDTLNDLPESSISLLLSEAYEPTSTLQYVNAQLVSHGFTRPPGLSFDGLANDDSQRLVKCLLGMLSQRVEDLGRTEELGSKLRTLSYEHERLQSMHLTAVDASANAERELQSSKSKLAASQRLLATETAAHKQTLAELQCTRISLQYLRSTTQNELKRKDKEVERVMERWNKVADAQTKLLTTPSGLRCANPAVGTVEPVRSIGLMEQVLGQAEEARIELVKENDALRTVLLGTANALQNNIYTVKGLSAQGHVEEPALLSHLALFAPPTSTLSQPENAHAILRKLLATLRDIIDSIATSTPVGEHQPGADIEIKKLNELVTSLRAELQQSRQSSSTLATQSQALLDRFTTHASERLISGRDPTPEEAAEMSLELMGEPEQDEARGKLDLRAAELKAEREKFTEAAVKLGKEKEALELERTKLLEEKRRWAVEQMLAELPPTPGPDPDLISPLRPTKSRLKQGLPSPPRARPRKTCGSLLGSPSKKVTVMKRAREGVTAEKESEDGSKKSKQRTKSGVSDTLDVLYEPEPHTDNRASRGDAEMQRSTTPEDSPPVTISTPVAVEMKSSLPLVLPTTFTLPPPSPASSITDINLVSVASQPSVPKQQIPALVPSFDTIPLAATSAPVVTAPPQRSRAFPSPRTPHLAFNPLLKHAYSPVRPSPLSRILMLADSPPSPCRIPSIQEEPGMSEDSDSKPQCPNAIPKRMLARECVPIDEPSSLRERTDAELNGGGGVDAESEGDSGERRLTAKEKGKGRVHPVVQGLTASEKENVVALHRNKPKASVPPSIGAPHLKTKSSKLVGPETKKMVGVPPNLKRSTAKSGAVPKAASGSGSRPLTMTVNANAGSEGGTTVKLGTKRVPAGNTNTSRPGKKRM